jgi:hypothetical protein
LPRKKIDRKNKKCYLEYVWLTTAEYAHLTDLLGPEKLSYWIQELNGYIGSKGKDPYESHYYTIQNWARRTGAKAKGDGKGTRDTEANREADRVIEALKDPRNTSRPSFDEKTRDACIALHAKHKWTWPMLYAFIRDGRLQADEIRAEFLKVYAGGER